MWMDDYVKMLEGAGVVGGSREMMASNMWVERAVANRADVTMNWNKFAAELKKMNDNMVELKKIKDNMVELKKMFGAFYASMIFIVFLFFVMNYNCKC
jgi:nitrogen fixation/metabolism regulation signal transduction histidine kinase